MFFPKNHRIFSIVFSALFLQVAIFPAVSLSAELIPLTIDAAHKTASLIVPKSVASVKIESRPVRGGKWTPFTTVSVKATPSTVRVSLPANFANKSWRVSIVRASSPATKTKYPAKFYSGKKSFAPAVATSYAVQASQSLGASNSIKSTSSVSVNASVGSMAPVTLNSAASQSIPTPTTGTPVQADIWETSGTTAYFFNQLRGLQVIDLSTPSNPILSATYRLPAVGQDLYVVQGNGSTNYAILLTQQNNPDTAQYSTGVLMLAVSGPSVQLVSSNSFPGWMADSRMVGNQLYLSTEQWFWDSNGNQNTTTLNQMTVDPVAGNIITGSSESTSGSSPVISAGDDWLAVSQYRDNNWQNSSITLYGLGTNGATLLTTNPILIQGSVSDEYDVQYSGGILSALSQQWVQGANNHVDSWWWYYQPVTTVQNFSPDGTLRGSLAVDGTNYYSTARFVGSRLYVVTSGQNNTLYSVDNSNATNPLIAGQTSLPGNTSQIDPIGNGNQLFTIGYDANWNLTASLYDISSSNNPSLLSTVGLASNANTSWGYSPATWNQQAYSVLDNSGLITIPYSCYNSDGTSSSYIQLITLDTNAGALGLAGTIATGANPLRSAMIGGALASITQTELVTADISNPTTPSILADLTLAWTVDKIAVSGNYLIQITANNTWNGEVPAATVTSVDDPDNALSQISLGSGVVVDAKIQGNQLYVLRQNPANTAGWVGIHPLMGNGFSTSTSSNPSLFLDIYDVSNLPQLTLVGSVSSQLPAGDSSWDVGGLLFPSANSVAVVAQPTARNYWWWHGPIMVDPIVDGGSVRLASDAVKVATPAVVTAHAVNSLGCYPWYGGYNQSTNPATAMIFQVNDPTAPVAEAPFPMTEQVSSPVKSATAGSGLLVFGYGDKEVPFLNNSGESLSSSRHHVRILDLTDPSTPVLGPAMDLPGRLRGISDLSSTGFLAWTETHSSGIQVQVSACDGVSVSQVNTLSLSQEGALAASGYDLFAVQGNSVNRYTLDQSGNLNPSGNISLNWSPSSLATSIGSSATNVVGNDWSHLFNSSWNTSGGSLLGSWNIDSFSSPDAGLDITLPDNSVLVPETSYGVGRYQP